MKLDFNMTLPTMYMLPLGKLLPRPDGGQKVKFWPKIGLFQNYTLNRVPEFFDKLFR